MGPCASARHVDVEDSIQKGEILLNFYTSETEKAMIDLKAIESDGEIT